MQKADGLPHDSVKIIVDSNFGPTRPTNSDALMAPTADPTGPPIRASASSAADGAERGSNVILVVVSAICLLFVAGLATTYNRRVRQHPLRQPTLDSFPNGKEIVIG